ncbi:alpha/beta fold hydrolase [Dactylosporangium sp. CA-233914]|uniref:alpha/beta fold hydrolase n=1 Tax=Dactylosporangium sp. CA-233914 TaxID=3239934 RepID=UPI003D8EB4BA
MSGAVPWSAGYARRSFQHGGGTVSWLELTDPARPSALPVVLVHGMQGTALEHCGVGRRLGGPAYLLDLRAHGRSSPAASNPDAGSVADQVAIVTAFIRQVVGRPVVLVGNSFGAMICALATRSAPDDVLGLALIGPAVRPSRLPIDPVRYLQWLIQKAPLARAAFDRDVQAGKRPEDLDALVASATPYLDLIPQAYLQELRAEPEPAWSVHDPDGRAALWRSRNDALVHLSRPRRWLGLLGELTPPALWLHGLDDPLMPAATAETVRRLLRRWEVVTLGATGHIPHLERVEETATSIQEWLGSAI